MSGKQTGDNGGSAMVSRAIFVEDWPVIESAPMVFYLPASPEKADLTALIEKYGGRVSEMHECYTYQIAPFQFKIKKNNFFSGDIYSAHWLIDSVCRGELLPKTDYFHHTDNSSRKHLSFTSANLHYTLTEAVTLFNIAMANPQASSGSSFWQEIEKKRNVLPNRTADSMRNFWKVNRKNGLERYLSKALEQDERFSHYFATIPVSKMDVPCPIFNIEERVRALAEGNAVPSIFQSEAMTAGGAVGVDVDMQMATASETKFTQNLPVGMNTDQHMTGLLQTMGALSPFQGNKVPVIDQDMQEKVVDQCQRQSLKIVSASGINNGSSSVSAIPSNNQQLMNENDKENMFTSQEESMFAIIAQDMMHLARDYKRPVNQLHDLFHQVSCNRERLIKVLDLQFKSNKNNTNNMIVTDSKQKEKLDALCWDIFSDLALKEYYENLSKMTENNGMDVDHPEDNLSYQHLIATKGQQECEARARYLQLIR